MANKYVTEEVIKQIGKTAEARTYEVERGAIRRFADAVGDPNPLFNNEVEARHSRPCPFRRPIPALGSVELARRGRIVCERGEDAL